MASPPPSPAPAVAAANSEASETFEIVTPDVTRLQERKLEFARKNPFVLAGALATCGVLGYGLIAMRRGDSKTSQLMMRWRIFAQGATVGIMIASATYFKMNGGEEYEARKQKHLS